MMADCLTKFPTCRQSVHGKVNVSSAATTKHDVIEEEPKYQLPVRG